MTSVFILKIQIATGVLSVLTSLALYIWYRIYINRESRKAEKNILKIPMAMDMLFVVKWNI